MLAICHEPKDFICLVMVTNLYIMDKLVQLCINLKIQLRSLAEHINYPAPGDLPLQAGEELLPRHAFRFVVIVDAELGVFLRLAGVEKGE